MQVFTDEEVVKWQQKNEWNCGIKVDGKTLYYSDAEANCIELKYPETPLRATYSARVASMMGIEDEANFYGAMLWITLWDIGSTQLEKAGWRIVERMRQSFGESRPLGAASGHFFRSDELVDLNAFLLPCFVFGWDAWLVPFGNNDFFVHISHDGYWCVVTRTKEAYGRVFAELKDLNPKEAPPKGRARFCYADSEL